MPSSLTLLTLNYVWLWARSAVRAEKEWARQIRWRGLVCGMHPMMRFTDSQIQQLFAWSARCSPCEYRQVFLRSARWKSSYRFFLSIAWSFFQLLQRKEILFPQLRFFAVQCKCRFFCITRYDVHRQHIVAFDRGEPLNTPGDVVNGEYLKK